MSPVRESIEIVTIAGDQEIVVACPQCGDGRWLADLLMPGGIRLTCWSGCGTWTPAQLARKMRQAASR